MIVDRLGELFEDRRKAQRRKGEQDVKIENRKEDRRQAPAQPSRKK